MQTEHQAQCPAGADARAVFGVDCGLTARGYRNRGGGRTAEEKQVSAQVAADRKGVAQVKVEADRAPQVEAVSTRLQRANLSRLEAPERSVASTQGEVRLDAPERNVHARLDAQRPQLPIGKIAEAK